MRKLLLIIAALAVSLLAGCGAEKDMNVEFTKPLVYQSGKEAPFEIKVTDKKGTEVAGLEVTAHFAMVDMDHGEYEAVLEETEDGLYAGKAALPMAGDWEIVFALEKDGKTTEKVLEYKVEKAEGVARINGEWVTSGDLEFYRFINHLHIEINREKDRTTLEGKALDDRMAYWDSQEKLNDDKNQLLTQIIRLRSMAILGGEKGYTASKKEVDEAITAVRNQYSESKAASKLIGEFGEKKFWDTQQKQYELIVLSQKVQNDLIQKVKKENPNVGDQEINYLAQKEYEELLVSQVYSLDIEIM